MRLRAPRRVLGTFVLALLLIVLGLSLQSVWASSEGPIFFVDANSPMDQDTRHDYHYRTLTALFAPDADPKPDEHDTVLVAPGIYSGNFSITAKGLTLRSTDGAEKTVIRGQVTINAEDVQLIGFSIDPAGTGPGVTIARDGVQLLANEIHEGTIGILIGVQSGSQRVELRDNQIFNNRQDGLSARDARDLELSGNEIRGNGGAGALLTGLQGALVEKNTITFNRLGGLQLLGSDQVEIRDNTISDNMLSAVMLRHATRATISDNELSSNEIGIFFWSASTNRVTGNRIQRNRAGGIFIRDSSQENVISNNQIEDNAGWGAPGLWLVGDASSNEISQNSLLSNGVGLLLSATRDGSPHGNAIDKNKIGDSDSEGVRVAGSDGRNVWQGNEIFSNNSAGLALLAGSDETITANQIHDNGAQGIKIENSERNLLQANRIEANGDDGLLVQTSAETVLQSNLIQANARSGMRLEHADQTRILNNTLALNRNEGLYAEASSELSVVGNLVKGNGMQGLYLHDIANADLQGNQIRGNSMGGVLLSQVGQTDLEGNQIVGNTQFGLEALQSPLISARRNWWGEPLGPAGAYNGAGNAVIGLSLAQIVPWLPAPPSQTVLASVSGDVVDWPRGNPLQFDVSDRADLEADVYLAPALAQSAPMLASRMLFIAAKLSGPPPGAPPLENALKFVSVQVQGLQGGTTQLHVLYRDEELPIGVRTADLRLFRLENGRWQAVDSEAQPRLHQVTAELSLRQLQGEPIALATGIAQQRSSAEVSDIRPPSRAVGLLIPSDVPAWSFWKLLATVAWLIVP